MDSWKDRFILFFFKYAVYIYTYTSYTRKRFRDSRVERFFFFFFLFLNGKGQASASGRNRSHSVLGTAKRRTTKSRSSPLLRAARHFHWPRTLTGLHRTLSSLDRCPMESACVCARAHVHARVPASSVSSSGSQTSISINIFRPIRGIKFVRMYNIKYVKKRRIVNGVAFSKIQRRISEISMPARTRSYRVVQLQLCFVSSGDLVVSNSRRKKEKEIKNRFKMIYLARGDYDERKKLVANVDNSRGQIS